MPGLLAAFTALVETHHATRHQVARYAALLHLSPGYLNERVRQLSGPPALARVHARLVLEAKRQLFYTPRRVAEISFALGFDDPSYFGRFFRRATGLSPANYRRATREMYRKTRGSPIGSTPARPDLCGGHQPRWLTRYPFLLMISQQVVITGATGHIGGQLVHALLAQGHRVTAVARPSQRLDALQQAGAAVAPGDLLDGAFLTQVLRGADAAFLMIPPNGKAPDVLADMRQGGEAIARAVQAAGLRRAVSLSSARVDQPVGNGPLFVEQEARLEAIAGLAVAHLRPAFFMDNLLANVGMIQRLGGVASTMRPDISLPMVATRDIAAKAAELLGGGPLPSQSVHYLLGPRNYSMQEVTTAFGQAIGRPDLPYLQLSSDQARQGMLKAGMSASMADLMDEMTRTQNEGKVVVRDVRTAASTTPTTLEAFARTVFAPAFQQAH